MHEWMRFLWASAALPVGCSQPRGNGANIKAIRSLMSQSDTIFWGSQDYLKGSGPWSQIPLREFNALHIPFAYVIDALSQLQLAERGSFRLDGFWGVGMGARNFREQRGFGGVLFDGSYLLPVVASRRADIMAKVRRNSRHSNVEAIDTYIWTVGDGEGHPSQEYLLAEAPGGHLIICNRREDLIMLMKALRSSDAANPSTLSPLGPEMVARGFWGYRRVQAEERPASWVQMYLEINPVTNSAILSYWGAAQQNRLFQLLPPGSLPLQFHRAGGERFEGNLSLKGTDEEVAGKIMLLMAVFGFTINL